MILSEVEDVSKKAASYHRTYYVRVPFFGKFTPYTVCMRKVNAYVLHTTVLRLLEVPGTYSYVQYTVTKPVSTLHCNEEKTDSTD